jgi:hypothetical protein
MQPDKRVELLARDSVDQINTISTGHLSPIPQRSRRLSRPLVLHQDGLFCATPHRLEDAARDSNIPYAEDVGDFSDSMSPPSLRYTAGTDNVREAAHRSRFHQQATCRAQLTDT